MLAEPCLYLNKPSILFSTSRACWNSKRQRWGRDGTVFGQRNEGGKESERSERTQSRLLPNGALAVQTTILKLSNGDLKKGDVVKYKEKNAPSPCSACVLKLMNEHGVHTQIQLGAQKRLKKKETD